MLHTLTETDLRQTIVGVLHEITPGADLEALPPDADLPETLGIDAFHYSNFMLGLDDAFDIDIPEADYARLTTVNDIVRYVRGYVP
jgi:acyl carrier protein